jgi:PAS domain S-box-containing protein
LKYHLHERHPEVEARLASALNGVPEPHAGPAEVLDASVYRTFFDATDHGRCVVEVYFDATGRGIDYRFLLANHAFEYHTGLVNVVGRTIRELVPRLEPVWAEVYGRVAMTGKPECFVAQSEAMQRWFDVHAFRVGEPAAYQVGLLFTDATERVRTQHALQDSQRLLRSTLDNFPTIIAFKDLHGHYLDVNRALETALGMSKSRIIGQTDHDLFPEPQARAYRQHDLRVIASKQAIQREDVTRRAGKICHLLDTTFPLIDAGGCVYGVGHISHDITGLKRAEEALRRANTQLREADQSKDEFLAMMAHELRNPLAVLSLATRLLANPDLDAATVRHQRDVCEHQVATLSRLVDDLLDVSRITRGVIRLQQQRVVLDEVLTRAVETVRPLLDERQHTLGLTLRDTPVSVIGDALRLEQVLVNLLTNAAKYTDPGGWVGVTMQRVEKHVQFVVTDSGIGLEPQMLERIFKLFGQGERALARSQGGLGIGLTVARYLVELHGGRIEARSHGPGQGAAFVVMLPVADEEQVVEAPAPVLPAGVAATPGKRILIVDDNVDVANSLCMLLELSGHSVVAVHDGPSALLRAAEFNPQLVLLDIGLPGMDGYEVARRLRELASTRNAVLAALTGYGSRKDQQQAMDAGFAQHFVKPVDIDRLEAYINSLG